MFGLGKSTWAGAMEQGWGQWCCSGLEGRVPNHPKPSWVIVPFSLFQDGCKPRAGRASEPFFPWLCQVLTSPVDGDPPPRGLRAQAGSDG